MQLGNALQIISMRVRPVGRKLGRKINSPKLPIKNIARIANRCPENIASVVKYVKLFLSKVLRKH